MNEDEERILQEIERRFYAADPDSARRIGATSLPRYLARNCKWAALGLVAGLVILLVGFASSLVVGVIGFAVMLVSAVVLIQNLRRMGRFGLQKIGAAAGPGTLGQTIQDAGRRLRRRLGGEEGDS